MKKVCVVTGSRADYGIMRPLLEKLDSHENISLDLVVTAMHLEEKYGYTYREIEKDGFNIVSKIFLNIADTSKRTLSSSLSVLTDKIADVFENTSYDLLIVLGDRYEMLPVVNIALIYNIPICHIHGGEKTLGNFDESIRHAITKMSHLHLVSTEEFKNRVIQLGEDPSRVFNIGAMGVENVLNQSFLSKSELEVELGVCLDEDYYVVLFHPVTLEDGSAKWQVECLVEALGRMGKKTVFIGSNSDTDSDEIMAVVRRYVDCHDNSFLFSSLSTRVFHSLVKNSVGLVGNSSCGLIEVPSLKVPTLNIGNRQAGRVYGSSVFCVDNDVDSIFEGLVRLGEGGIDFYNPYEKPFSSLNAKNIIVDYLFNNDSVVKDFYDLDFDLNVGLDSVLGLGGK